MADREYIRDRKGRFADVPGVGDDAPANNSATTPGGTRTNVPQPERNPYKDMSLSTAQTTKGHMTRLLQGGKISASQREQFDREYKQVQDRIMELRSAEIEKSKAQRAAEKRAEAAESRRLLDEAGITKADPAEARKEGDMLLHVRHRQARHEAQEKAVLDALKNAKATKAAPITRNEVGYALTVTDDKGRAAGLGPYFDNSGELSSTMSRLREKGLIKVSPNGGVYAARPRQPKPDPLRTASGTVLNRDAQLNSARQQIRDGARYSW